MVVARAHAVSPAVQITALSSQGQAPFTVHVHALTSSLGGGDSLTARYEWNFGDPKSGPDNRLVGWNAAHTYDKPGEYVIRLTITNATGAKSSASLRVTVQQPQRRMIYVSPNGNDHNPGTKGQPIRTVNRVQQMLGANTAILFQCGGVYKVPETLIINSRNVVIGAWGNGAPPTLRGRTGVSNDGIITLFDHSDGVTIQDLCFDAPVAAPDNQMIRGVRPSGRNVTVRRCRFERVSYAVNAELFVRGLMVHNNRAGVLGAYLVWGVGQDHVYLSNTVAGSMMEHNIRLGGAQRVLIARNRLTNTVKSTIWAMLGSDVYVTDNDMHRGRMIVGPDFNSGAPPDRMRNCVAEGNYIDADGVVVYAGAERVMFRNNVLKLSGGEAFSVWGWFQPMQRRASDVRIYNNTATNSGSNAGNFLKIGDDAWAVEAENNLYCAPNMNAKAGAANVHSMDDTLHSHHFRSNLWSTPAVGKDPHRLLTGGVHASSWASFQQTQQERYRAFSFDDLGEDYRPRFNATQGARLRGVHADFYGRPRPKSGKLTMGAVETR